MQKVEMRKLSREKEASRKRFYHIFLHYHCVTTLLVDY